MSLLSILVLFRDTISAQSPSRSRSRSRSRISIPDSVARSLSRSASSSLPFAHSLTRSLARSSSDLGFRLNRLTRSLVLGSRLSPRSSTSLALALTLAVIPVLALLKSTLVAPLCLAAAEERESVAAAVVVEAWLRDMTVLFLLLFLSFFVDWLCGPF